MSKQEDKKELESAAALAGALAHVRQAEADLIAVTRQSNTDREVDLPERAATLRAAHKAFNKAL
jgi:tetrahydromethanopterin S-methyltransferase subunit E